MALVRQSSRTLESQGNLPDGVREHMAPLSLGQAPGYVYIVRLTQKHARKKDTVLYRIGVTDDLARRIVEIKRAVKDLIHEVASEVSP